MKKLFWLISILMLSTIVYAQYDLQWQWAKRAGGETIDSGSDISADNNGNTYISGTFHNTADFGSILLDSRNLSADVFVAKMNSSGDWLWAKSAGSDYEDCSYSITNDNNGNCYIIGSFRGTADFGNTILTGDSLFYDIYIAKLDSNGNWLWARKAGGTGNDEGYSICSDNNGNCFITGYFEGNASFGSTTLSNNGQKDIFISKLDTNGNFLWTHGAGNTLDDRGRGIATDGNGNCYVTGDCHGTVSFGNWGFPGIGGSDVFITKFNTYGICVWAYRGGGYDDDSGVDLDVDGDGNIYITGSFTGPAHFGPYSVYNSGIFVTKMNSEGFSLWARQITCTSSNASNGITVDSTGNSYITGNYSGTATFGLHSITCFGDEGTFIAKMGSTGTWMWVTGSTGESVDRGINITKDIYSNFYITGYFQENTEFGTNILISLGDRDVYIAKLQEFLITDLQAVSISGGTNLILGALANYHIIVKNNGNISQSDYAVKLYREGAIELVSVIGTDIEPQETIDYSITWIPDIGGYTYVYGKVDTPGDSNSLNDETLHYNIFIESHGTITGVVMDLLNQPLMGATVTCGELYAITYPGGGYSFELFPGIYNLTASYPDCASVTQTGIQVVIAQPTYVNFQMSITSNDDNLTSSNILTSIYPNPFNIETTISYSIKTIAPVTVEIYNTKGQKVKTLVNATKTQGNYIVNWNGTDEYGAKVSGGIYLYRMNAGKYTSTQKMILLK